MNHEPGPWTISAKALFVIEHYFAFVLLGVTACAIGRRLTGRLVYHGVLEAVCFSRLYALDDVKMAYYADGTYFGDSYGEASYDRNTSKMHSGEALYDELKLFGVNYLLVNSAVEKTKLPKDEFFRRNFRLTFSGNNTEVYELSSGNIYQ